MGEKKISSTEQQKIVKWIEEQNTRLNSFRNPDGTNGNTLFNDVLKFNLYFIWKSLHRDFDYFLINDGKEGLGKSTLAIQEACFVDPSFNLSRVCFTTEEFITALDTATRGQAIIFDEAGTNLYSREAMRRMNIFLNKIFMVMRQKNLFIILNIPSFFMLDSYIRNHRVNALLHITSRGKFTFYNEDRTKSLSIKAAKYLNHSAVAGNFVGYFNKQLPHTIDEQEYRDRKTDHMNRFMKEILNFRDRNNNFVDDRKERMKKIEIK